MLLSSYPSISKWPLRALASGLCFAFGLLAPVETENAIANGDTRTLHLHHAHTGENIDATFRVNGQYDYAVLEKLNWFLRDWRRDESTKMDPRLFDVVWETYRESGSSEPIQVVSAYRSPQTNAMLRRRSKAVAEHSQHILGKAMDMHYVDVPMSKIREIGMRLQRGGVGYYPTAGTPFVHLDVGSVRAWPRMNYDQLVRLFPDGKTVHLPPNGQPLARYEEARAEIEARGGSYTPTLSEVRSRGFFASLFGSSDDDEDGGAVRGSGRGRQRTASLGTATGLGPSEDNDSAAAYFSAEAARQSGQYQAERRIGRANVDLPSTTPRPLVSPQPDMIAQNAPLPQIEPELQTASTPNIPLPPRRPDELMAQNELAAATMPLDVPLPPIKPAQLRLALNTESTNPSAPSSAPSALISPNPSSSAIKRQSLTPARIDASNYHSLTASLSFSHQNWTMAALNAPPKRASRSEISRVLFGPAMSLAQNFSLPQRQNAELTTGSFKPSNDIAGARKLASLPLATEELDPIVTGSLGKSLN